MTEEVRYPKYKKFGREIVDSADVDSLDTLGAMEGLEEEGRLDVDEDDLGDFSLRELRMMALEDRLRTGEGFAAKMFGIEVRVMPADISGDPPIPIGGFSGPDGGDFSGDREPRSPIDPSDAGAMALSMPQT